MPDDSKRLDDCEKIQGQHQTELVDHARRRDLSPQKAFDVAQDPSDYLAIYERIRSEGEASKKVTALPRAA
jgi:hypothetical protein